MLLSASNWHCFSAAGRTSHQHHHHHHLETRIEPCRTVAQFAGAARPFIERIFEFGLFNFALDRWGKYQRRFCAKINKSALTSPFTFCFGFIRALAVSCVSCAASAAPQFNQILLFDFASLRVFLFPATWLAVRISFKCLAFSLIWFSRLPLLPPPLLLLLSVTQQFSVAYINGYSAIRFQTKRFSHLHSQFPLLSKLKFIK